jgi:hypothetical protein
VLSNQLQNPVIGRNHPVRLLSHDIITVSPGTHRLTDITDLDANGKESTAVSKVFTIGRITGNMTRPSGLRKGPACWSTPGGSNSRYGVSATHDKQKRTGP